MKRPSRSSAAANATEWTSRSSRRRSVSPTSAKTPLEVVVGADVAGRHERGSRRDAGELAHVLLDPLALVGERELGAARRRAAARSPTRSSAGSRRRARARACLEACRHRGASLVRPGYAQLVLAGRCAALILLACSPRRSCHAPPRLGPAVQSDRPQLRRAAPPARPRRDDHDPGRPRARPRARDRRAARCRRSPPRAATATARRRRRGSVSTSRSARVARLPRPHRRAQQAGRGRAAPPRDPGRRGCGALRHPARRDHGDLPATGSCPTLVAARRSRRASTRASRYTLDS